jgi:5-formyltetrahydrofolate cyclo-ligase
MTDELEPPCGGTVEQIRLWRKEARRGLIARRNGLSEPERLKMAEKAKWRLAENVDLFQYRTIGFYWPIESEIDCQDLMCSLAEASRNVALPVVIERNQPVEFWKWEPSCSMQPGMWDIPIPRQRDVVEPDALVIPLVGFDLAGYRLGYGGGYYDRTIAAALRRPFCIGLGFSLGLLSSICPQAHDIQMDVVVTDQSVTIHSAIPHGRCD